MFFIGIFPCGFNKDGALFRNFYVEWLFVVIIFAMQVGYVPFLSKNLTIFGIYSMELNCFIYLSNRNNIIFNQVSIWACLLQDYGSITGRPERQK